MDLGLAGKVAIVTGASMGIGRAAAAMLAQEGATVVGLSRSAPQGQFDRVEHFACDLSDADAPARAVAHAVGRHGRLDVVVNNAAAGTLHAGVVEEPIDSWEQTLNLNLFAALRMCRAAMPHLLVRGGAIVNVTSVNSRLPATEAASYSGAKAALLNVGKALATEYVGRGVRVVTVSPGLTATPMWLGDTGVASQIAQGTGTTKDEVAESAAQDTPLKRFLTPEEVAVWIVLAASRVASAMTGTEIVVDGGLTPTI